MDFTSTIICAFVSIMAATGIIASIASTTHCLNRQMRYFADSMRTTYADSPFSREHCTLIDTPMPIARCQNSLVNTSDHLITEEHAPTL